MNLPYSENISVNLLSGCFKDTSASYKYYWFISILEAIKENIGCKVSFNYLLVKMICNAWYPVHYYKLSFGLQDKLSQNIKEIQKITRIPIDEDKEIIFKELINTENKKVRRLINHFNKNVPYYFLSPWINGVLKSSQKISEIKRKSSIFYNNLPYRLIINKEKYIEISPKWYDYFNSHLKILYDFCYWNLTIYLQNKNPNVPNIPLKIIKPIERGSLTEARKYWNKIFSIKKVINCIYSNVRLDRNNYSLDHFIPWSFVSHNLLWNLIPTTSQINVSKNFRLPDLKKYGDAFISTQYHALRTYMHNYQSKIVLEDFYMFFKKDYEDLEKLDFRSFKRIYYGNIRPLIQVANNMGFKYWRY